MSEKFEDLMRPGLSRRSFISGRECLPDSVQWINLLSVLCFIAIFLVISDPTSWDEAMLGAFPVGALFGPIVFMVGQIFCRMLGGRGSFWVAVAYFSSFFVVLLVTVYWRWF